MARERIKTSVIIPAYNEEKGLPIVLYKLLGLSGDSYEVVVVDDGSSDRTVEIAKQYPIMVIGYKDNRGKGCALRRAVRHAKGEDIIWADADDTYPIEVIPQMVEAMSNGYDVVVCSRVYGRENIPRFNRMGLWLFKVLIQRIYGFKPSDPCSGLYGVKKQYLERMGLTSKRFAIEPEISIKGGRMRLRTLEIPIKYKPRVGGSKLNGIKVGFEDLITILRLVFWKPRN